jgi:hypothetical protein
METAEAHVPVPYDQGPGVERNMASRTVASPNAGRYEKG